MLRRSVRWLGAGFAILVVLVITVPYLIPMEQYKEQLEDIISDSTGFQTKIDSIRVQVFPVPALHVSNLQITRQTEQTAGSEQEVGHQELMAVKATISLKLGKLLEGKVVIPKLTLVDVLADLNFLREFVESFQSSDDQQVADEEPSFFELHKIAGKSVKLRLSNGKILGPYHLALNLDMETGFSDIRLSREDKTAQLEIIKDKQTTHYTLTGSDWNEPLGYPLQLKSIKAEAIQSGSFLVFSGIDVDTLGGNLTGKGTFSWQSDWKTSGNIKLTGVNLKDVTALLGTKSLPGNLDSDCSFSLNAPTAETLLNNQDVKCQVEAAVFDGKITGEGYLRAKNGWQSSGAFTSEQLDLKKALQYFDKESISGALDTNCTYSLSASLASELFKNPDISCDYKILDGEIYKADLEKAASLLSSNDEEPGSTPFSEFKGIMKLKNNNIVITDLNLESSILGVRGKLKIEQYTNLSGELDVGVKKTASIVSIPLKISGTVDEPKFRPTNDAIAGGAIGTFLLGPGIGTAIGMKIGKGLSNLFGGGDDEEDEDKKDDTEAEKKSGNQ